MLEVYNAVLDATRTIIQYNSEAGFTTYTTDGVEATYMGELTVVNVPYGSQQTPKTATYVAASGDVPVIETASVFLFYAFLND